MIHNTFIALVIRLRREMGFWDTHDVRDRSRLHSQICEKMQEMADLVWPKFELASAQAKETQADRVRESSPALKAMSAKELEDFLMDLAERIEG